MRLKKSSNMVIVCDKGFSFNLIFPIHLSQHRPDCDQSMCLNLHRGKYLFGIEDIKRARRLKLLYRVIRASALLKHLLIKRKQSYDLGIM